MELFTHTNRILSRLNALERTIGDVANEALPLERAARVQRRANDVTHDILVRVGMQLDAPKDDFDVRHETDELLKMAVIPNSAVRTRESAPHSNAHKDQEPIDVGPEGAADPTLRLPTDDSEEYRADSSEEVSSPEIEALVGFSDQNQGVDVQRHNQTGVEELITFETIDATDEEHRLDAQDEHDPAPLTTPNSGNDIQWVVDESPEDEPIETWDATASLSADDTAQVDDDTIATLEAPAPNVPQATPSTEDTGVVDAAEPEDLLPALSEEEEEPDIVHPGQQGPESNEPIAVETAAVKPKGASVRLKTIRVSKKTAAPRQSASVRLTPSTTPDEDVLALGDSFDFHQADSHQKDGTADAIESDEDQVARTALIAESLDQARNALKEGVLEEAVRFYSDVIDRDGQHYNAYLERGRVHLDLGDYGRAMSDFTVANDIHPNNPNTGVALADLFFARKEYSRAVEFYTDALRELPEHAMAICRRGICYYYKRNFVEALTDLENAYRLDKSIPNIATYVVMAKKKVKSG